MRLWVGGDFSVMPNGYTYAENFEITVEFINRCKRISKIVGESHDSMWHIEEIKVPFSEVDKYASLFAVIPYTFLLNTREE